MSVAYQTITWGGVVGSPAGVTAIKDLYYLAYGSDEEALRAIAAAGYNGVEMFDGNLQRYQDNPAVLQDWLQKGNLELVAVYSGANFIYADCFDDELARLDRAAQLGRQFGATYFVVGGGAIRNDGVQDSDYERLARALDRLVTLAHGYGLLACYHPHLGTIVQTPDELDRLMALTEVALCPDTGHILAAGGDPVEVIQQYRDRIPYVHLKDFGGGQFLPLGQGELDLTSVVATLGGSDEGSWWTIELDSFEGEPSAAALSSLRALQLAEASLAPRAPGEPG
jgi:inosose dehydratase